MARLHLGNPERRSIPVRGLTGDWEQRNHCCTLPAGDDDLDAGGTRLATGFLVAIILPRPKIIVGDDKPVGRLHISGLAVLQGGQHHLYDILGCVVCMKGSPRVGGVYQPVVLLSCQKHELALTAPGDLDRSSVGSLDHLSGSVVEVGQGKMSH